MEGYFLVLSILVLSGVIATVGDRLGSRVGKARLSLFGLRPRKTAVVITILTGSVISASSLTILFIFSESIRERFFEFEALQQRLQDARQDLEATTVEKENIDSDRLEAEAELSKSQELLKAINQSLQEARQEQQLTDEQLTAVEARAEQLRTDVELLQQEQDELIAQRDQVRAQIVERDREIQAQEEVIAQGEARLAELEAAQEFLAQEVRNLEQEYALLRTGEVVLTRGQVLNLRLLQVPSSGATRPIVDQLLREANRFTVRKIRPSTGDPTEPLIRVPQVEVDRLIQEISDGQEYVVRILSAGNYVFGREDRVEVFIDVALNQVVFSPGELIARTSTDSAMMEPQAIRERLDLLISASQFRAERAGIVSENVEIQALNFVNFLERVTNYKKPLTIQAVALEPIYTLGPLRLGFIAFENDREVFRSD